MSLVQSIKRQRETRSFADYADLFIGVVKSYLADSARVDVVFDRYLPNSIKHGTRIKRARGSKGIRIIIDGRNVKIPDNWTTYISVPENRASLAKFLSEEMINAEGEIITSGGFEQQDHAMSNQNSDVSGLFATHEEADTRIILHGGHALSKEFQRLIVVCKDTDVLLMLYAHSEFLPNQIWMKAGTSTKPKYIRVHDIDLTENIKNSVLAFHASTGSDSTSQVVVVLSKVRGKSF